MRKIFMYIAIFPIVLYQKLVSPMLGSSCRFTPTCSQYTKEAITEWGVVKGIWLGIKRISKCHPWGSHGYDPIPQNNDNDKTEKK